MSGETYTDRRGATGTEQLITLETNRISVSENGKLRRAIDFGEIQDVRLGVEMAGRDSQIVCRINARDGTRIVFGSRSWTGLGEWQNRADRFRAFNASLHRALLPLSSQIEFIEGHPLWVGFALSGLGVLVFVLGAGFGLYMLSNDNVLGFGGIPGMIIGLYLAWMFRPRASKPYDPSLYAHPPQ